MRMSLPSSNAVSAAPAAICPACPRSCWISGRNGAVEAIAASTDKAPVTSVAQSKAMGAQQPGNGIGRRKLRAVDQGEAFLRPQRDRRETGRGQRIAARHSLAVDKRLPLADHDGGHMRQRRQIAGRADRSLLRHQRINAARQHACSCSMISRRTPEAPRPNETIFSAIIRRTIGSGVGAPYPAAMRHDEIALQQRRLIRRNAFRRQFSEPGIDAVNRRLPQPRPSQQSPMRPRRAARTTDRARRPRRQAPAPDRRG